MENETKKKFNWKRLLITLGIVIVTTVVIGVVTWFLMDQQAKNEKMFNDKQLQELQKQINELKKESDKIATITNNSENPEWKAYSNSIYKFSFKYPANWTIKEDSFTSESRRLSLTSDLSETFELYLTTDGPIGRGFEGIKRVVTYKKDMINGSKIILGSKTSNITDYLQSESGPTPTEGYAIIATTQNTHNGYYYYFQMLGNKVENSNRAIGLFEKIADTFILN